MRPTYTVHVLNRVNLIYNIHTCISLQGCTNVTDVAMENSNLAPYVLIIGNWEEASQAFLVVDKQVITEMKIQDVPFVLMSAFFVYNIHYPSGCSNFYTFMEVFTLGFVPRLQSNI